MTRFSPILLLLAGALCQAQPVPLIDQAFDRMYRHNFSGAQEVIAQHIAAHPDDPLGYAVKAAAYLFYELDRLQILESEFFNDDKRILDKKKAVPDPKVKEGVMQNIEKTKSISNALLAKDANHREALLSLCMALGVQTDYLALIEKRQLGSLSYAKESQSWAVKLLKVDPNYYDAYLTTGVSEYLMGSMPFFVKWFVKFEQTQGSKTEAVKNLTLVAQKGRYFRPFAKVLLSVIHLREKRPLDAEILLGELNREFPENPLFRKELAKLQARRKVSAGE
ncbi:MAG: hypothetical protein JNK87_20510 [Bryobacterales bacterium]|nr:hypothetical protein [Bryobacterales bacterium]